MSAKTIADLAHSLGVSEKDVEDACIMRVRASFNACQGIPINALEADVVKQMADTLRLWQAAESEKEEAVIQVARQTAREYRDAILKELDA